MHRPNTSRTHRIGSRAAATALAPLEWAGRCSIRTLMTAILLAGLGMVIGAVAVLTTARDLPSSSAAPHETSTGCQGICFPATSNSTPAQAHSEAHRETAGTTWAIDTRTDTPEAALQPADPTSRPTQPCWAFCDSTPHAAPAAATSAGTPPIITFGEPTDWYINL